MLDDVIETLVVYVDVLIAYQVKGLAKEKTYYVKEVMDFLEVRVVNKEQIILLGEAIIKIEANYNQTV